MKVSSNRIRTRELLPLPHLIAESFDLRTLANMQVALDRACANIANGEEHRTRRHIAAHIAECAGQGNRTLTALCRAAGIAAAELQRDEPA